MEEKVTQKDRIISFKESTGLSMRHFERSIGVGNGYFNQLKNKPSSKVLEKLLTAYPELRREWILYGRGEMIDETTANNNVELTASQEYIKHLEEEIEYLKKNIEDKDTLIKTLIKHGTRTDSVIG